MNKNTNLAWPVTYGDSWEMLENILGCLKQAVIVTDLSGRICFTSPVVESLFGFTSDEMEGKTLSVLFTPEDVTYLFSNLMDLAQKNVPFEGELMLRRKDQTRFFAFIIMRAMFEPGRGQAMVFICIQNIDKEKQLEKILQEAHNEDLVQIARGVAHELRNPLASIGGYSKKLYASCDPNEAHDRYYRYILNDLQKIEKLVKKTDSFATMPKPCFTNELLKDLIEEALQLFVHPLENKTIRVNKCLTEMILRVDKNLSVRAFMILIENAIEAMEKFGELTFTSGSDGRHYWIRVTDTGIGILPRDLPFIFNPFFSTKADGAGIDLAAVKRIMGLHDGRIEVESEPGQGASFNLIFPRERRRAIRIVRMDDSRMTAKELNTA
jgi:PAS domain S-box-containing protein